MLAEPTLGVEYDDRNGLNQRLQEWRRRSRLE